MLQSQATAAALAVSALQNSALDMQSQMTALQASLPAASNSLPSALANTSLVGTASSFARSDHTHQSTGQTTRIAVSGIGGLITWTYPIPYTTMPFVVATCECASGASNPYIVNLVGQAGLTSVTLSVFKTTAVTMPAIATNLVNYVVNQFSVAPAGIYVNILARSTTP